MRRTAEQAQETRIALLNAGLITFKERGWKGATFQEIASRAGVTRGAIHHHFTNKRGLLTEALKWGWETYGNQVFSLMEGPDLHTQLTQFLLGYVRLLQEDETFIALASTTVLVTPQAFEQEQVESTGLDEWHERLSITIKAQLPAVHHAASKQIAGLIIVLIQGFTIAGVSRPQDLPKGAHLEPAIASLVTGLIP